MQFAGRATFICATCGPVGLREKLLALTAGGSKSSVNSGRERANVAARSLRRLLDVCAANIVALDVNTKSISRVVCLWSRDGPCTGPTVSQARFVCRVDGNLHSTPKLKSFVVRSILIRFYCRPNELILCVM